MAKSRLPFEQQGRINPRPRRRRPVAAILSASEQPANPPFRGRDIVDNLILPHYATSTFSAVPPTQGVAALQPPGSQWISPAPEQPWHPEPFTQAGVQDTPLPLRADQQPAASPASTGGLSIEKDAPYFLLLARSLERQALDEVEELKRQTPNDAVALERHEKRLDLITMFAAGFTEIAAALEAFIANQDPVLAGKALSIAKVFSEKVSAWWEAHGVGFIHSGAQIGLVGAGVAMLGLLHVNPDLAALIAGPIAGGKDVVAAIRAYGKRE
jgi:hypothetical protein